MSLFDSISNSISSLFDDDATSAANSLGSSAAGALNTASGSSGFDWFGLAKGAVLGNDAQNKADAKAQTQEDYLYKFLERNTAMQPISEEGKFQSHPNKQYGAGNFSVDPMDIQKEWQAYLQGVADPSTVPGHLYKANGAN